MWLYGFSYPMSILSDWLAKEVASDRVARRKLTLRELLAQAAPGELAGIDEALARCEAASSVAHTPIVGVCGMMNSGKSTLVASFLSPTGRQRVLIGDAADEGTHRFVLWAPMSWRNEPHKETALRRLLETTFQSSWEALAEDPEAAYTQANARTHRLLRFGIPLIAFDPGLDIHQVALLDTPDIQRRHQPGSREETARVREAALIRSARICSAFVVVTRFDAMEDERFARLLQRLEPGRLPLHVVVTKVAPAYRDLVRGDLIAELEHKGLAQSVDTIFQSPYLALPTPSGYPAGVQYEDTAGLYPSLAALFSTLDPAQLQREFLAEKETEGLRQIRAAWDGLAERSRQDKARFLAARADLLRFLSAHFVDGRGRLRSLYSPEVTGALLESFTRTAPWYLKPMMCLHRSVFDFIGNLKEATLDKGRKLLAFLGQNPFQNPAQIDELTRISPGQLAASLLGSGWLPPDADRKALDQVWESAFTTMLRATVTDPEALQNGLDEATRRLWDEAGVWRKALAAGSFLVTLAGALAAVIVLPVDAGLSTVYSATLAELFSAVGLAIIAQGAAIKTLEAWLEQLAARPQITALFAFLQDALGIPRADAQAMERLAAENGTLDLRPYPGPEKVEAILPISGGLLFDLVPDALANLPKDPARAHEPGRA